MRTALEIIFWLSAGLLIYAQFGYPLLLAIFSGPAPQAPSKADYPSATLIIAAYAEATVIEAKVKNALALDYPRECLQIIVACDGSPDDTPAIARAAGADLVLDLPHGGKMAAQNTAVEQATGEILAFSDANTMWEPDALKRLIDAFEEPGIDYVCGRVNFVNETGDNQEGLYWRYEMWLRARESSLRSVTAGNGAIYAVDPATYKAISPVTGHDLTLPFRTVKLGGRAIDAPAARASEVMVPNISGEFKRKRRMMSFAWPIILGGGMLKPKGYGATYTWMIFSHRVLRYEAPFLHLAALITSAILAPESTLYLVLLILQLALLLAALIAPIIKFKPFLVARYYVLTTASVALGLVDYMRKGTEQILDEGWTPPEGTR
ncbi:MAG: glycosyltransferase [Solirubrobacterales bacterium]|nr:glycosyltransferase [Solirubrobacterales bacterium]